MRPFVYQRAATPDAALRLLRALDPAVPHTGAGLQFLAGGTTLVDLMKLDVMRPQRVVDINALDSAAEWGEIQVTDRYIRLGALVRMAQAAEHEEVRSAAPMIGQSLSLAASQQLRNMASLGGNLLQRTRCPYFRDTSWSACNKRLPGSGCAALDGFNRQHAVLGASDDCIATYPGDFAQALIALDATLEILGPNGARSLALAKLHRLPADAPHIETSLGEGELIRAVMIPVQPWMRRSVYLKVRDRESYEFALASAAVALDVRGSTVGEARVALGGVATVPWRSRAAEDALRGQRFDEEVARAAADAAFADATVRQHNAYKVPLGKATLVRALMQAAAMEV
jgi:xanthine dehydrogenase YagS FAD-binding subunit